MKIEKCERAPSKLDIWVFYNKIFQRLSLSFVLHSWRQCNSKRMLTRFPLRDIYYIYSCTCPKDSKKNANSYFFICFYPKRKEQKWNSNRFFSSRSHILFLSYFFHLFFVIRIFVMWLEALRYPTWKEQKARSYNKCTRYTPTFKTCSVVEGFSGEIRDESVFTWNLHSNTKKHIFIFEKCTGKKHKTRKAKIKQVMCHKLYRLNLLLQHLLWYFCSVAGVSPVCSSYHQWAIVHVYAWCR